MYSVVCCCVLAADAKPLRVSLAVCDVIQSNSKKLPHSPLSSDNDLALPVEADRAMPVAAAAASEVGPLAVETERLPLPVNRFRKELMRVRLVR